LRITHFRRRRRKKKKMISSWTILLTRRKRRKTKNRRDWMIKMVSTNRNASEGVRRKSSRAERMVNRKVRKTT
jgi:hypothetical protein